MRVHEVASFEHLPDDLLGLQVIYSLLITLTLYLVEDGPVELFEDQVNSVVFAKDFHQVHNVVVLQ